MLISISCKSFYYLRSGGCESSFGPAKNPWNHKKLGEDFYVPGGSSGGSASAVASGATYLFVWFIAIL